MSTKREVNALDALDRSDEAFLMLVDRAADIIGIDLSLLAINTANVAKSDRRVTHSFKEQWVLRWLVRRFAALSGARVAVKTEDDSKVHLRDARPWLLLYHLLLIIPNAVIIDIFAERKFTLPLEICLSYCASNIPEKVPRNVNAGGLHGTNGEHDRASKRRRTSNQSIEHQCVSVTTRLLLRICAMIAELSVHGTYDGSGTVLFSSVEETASFLLVALRLAHLQIQDSSKFEVVNTDETAAIIATMASTWNARPSPSSEAVKSKDLSTFDKQCLPTCLQLIQCLNALTSRSGAETKRAVRALRTLIAKTTILPLRMLFWKEYAKQWKNHRQCQSWADMAGYCKAISERFASSQVNIIVETADLLYDVALRLVPQHDHRKKQQEQLWLDALLLGLVHLTCPRLPQLNLGSSGEVEIIDTIFDNVSADNTLALERLTTTASHSSSTPSIQTLSYLTASILCWQQLSSPWATIACLVQSNSTVLLSNNRMPTSDFALTQLLSRLEQSVVTQNQYQLVKDQVLLPLLQIFATSRALREFVQLWHSNLQEAMRKSDSGTSLQDGISAMLAWQDEDMFDEFQRQIGRTTSTTVSENLLKDAIKGVQELSNRVGSTLDIFATLALATAILNAKSRRVLQDEASILREMLPLVTRALGRQSDYQGQRWRLWRLLHLLQHRLDHHVPLGLFKGEAVQASLEHAIRHTTSYSPHQYQECFERFKVLLHHGSTPVNAQTKSMAEELDTLRVLLVDTIKATPIEISKGPWDGNCLHITCTSQLAEAMLGILIAQQTTSGLLDDFRASLLRDLLAVGHQISVSIFMQRSSNRLRHLISKTLLGADITTGRKVSRVFQQALAEGSETPIDSLLQALEMMGPECQTVLGAGTLRRVAERLFDELRTKDPKIALPTRLATYLAFLAQASMQGTISFAKLDKWSEWANISKRLATTTSWSSADQLFVVVHSLNEIFCRVYRNAKDVGVEDAAGVRTFVNNVNELLTITRPSKSKVRLVKDPLLLVTARIVMEYGESCCAALPDFDAEAFKTAFITLLTSDLRVLSAGPWNEATLASTLVLLESYSTLTQSTSAKDISLDILTSLEQQIKEVTVSAEAGSAVSDLAIAVMDYCTMLQASFRAPDDCRDISEEVLDLVVGMPPATTPLVQADSDKLFAKAEVFVRSLRPSQYVDCLAQCLQQNASLRLSLVAQAVAGVIVYRVSQLGGEPDPLLSGKINAVASLALQKTESGYAQALLELDNVNMGLTKIPQVISQATIDSLLAQLASLLSTNNIYRTLPDTPPEAIYHRVCVILGSLLSRFRRRLSDRHHLILPILQQLLRCLFFSEQVTRRARQPAVIGSDPNSLLRSLPIWLKTDTASLPASSATDLTRTLSSICNPTVSAAKASRKRGRGSELNDETKRVKAVAGQHLHYLVMDYCRCTLDGDIAPDVREKLMPGMYTLLDAMGRDVMRAMNAAMDPSSRAIFKTLYDDWVRYGKWDKS